MLVFGTAAAVAALPWLAKNLVLTGNPISPFFLPGKYWDPVRAWWFGRFGTGPGLLGTLAAPWNLMVTGAREEDIGPLFLAFLPLLALGWRARTPEQRRTAAWMLAVIAVAGAVWLWSIGGSRMLYQYRLVYTVFPLAAVLAAAAFDGLGRLATPHLRVRWVFGGLVALALGLNVAGRLPALVQDNPLAVVLGLQTQDEYLAGRLGRYYVVMGAINDLPPGHHVMFLWEPRSYYCGAGCEPDTLLDHWWHPRQTVGDARAIADSWRRQGITHVLLFETGRQFLEDEGFDPFTQEDWRELDRLAREELVLVQNFDGEYQLYELRP
jgi:hypothetical protein